MKKFLLPLITFLIFGLASCSPNVSIKVKSDNSIDISFKTGFSDEISKTLKSMSGVPENEPILSTNDMITFLTEAGASNIKANIPNQNEVQSSGTINSIKNSALYSTGCLKQEKNELILTIGPTVIKTLYTLLDENTKSYLDIMMIPVLIDETMSVEEYKLLLASVYGPSFAKEMVEGDVTITLENSKGKKTTINENLGTILTMTKDKTWSFEL